MNKTNINTALMIIRINITIDQLEVRSEVSHECLIALIFSFSTMIQLIMGRIPPGIQRSYCIDSKLFKSSRLRTTTKTVMLIEVFRHMDDAAINTVSTKEIQTIKDF